MNNKFRKIKILNLPNSYLFDESINEFGTIKDRRNKKVIEEALRLHVDKLVLITSGNNGYSLARLAQNTNIKVVCVVNRQLDEKTKELLKNVSYQVIELNLEQKILRPEEIIAIARENEEEVIWDVTNGYEETYIPIVEEICKKIIPDYIVCPVGSGGIYIGIIEGIEKYSFTPEINIYDNKVVFMSLKERFALIIESEELADALKKSFELAWLGAKQHE